MNVAPLNSLLYSRLQRRFGRVRISNQGEAMQSRYVKGIDGRDDLVIEYPGEYYQVCCPYCHDTRYRLYINHTWGHRDDHGRLNLWLAICYNESCLNVGDRRNDLWEEMNELGWQLADCRVREGSSNDQRTSKVKLPGPTFPLHKLPPTHQANVYLTGRHYDIDRLGKFYRVGYCSDSVYYLARNRIVVPFYQGGELMGAQARYIGELDWKDKDNPPKWWTIPGTKKGRLLYNLDVAKRYKTAIVVEGCGDVWSAGPMAVATLGDRMSRDQERLLVSNFSEYSVVLMYDPEAMETPSTVKLLENLSDRFRKGLATVVLPAGRDPGSLDRKFLWPYIRQQAAVQGVAVSFQER